MTSCLVTAGMTGNAKGKTTEMASHPPGRYGRAVMPLLIVALGAGGALLLHQRAPGTPQTPRTATAAGTQGTAAIYSRLAPSVVDVTARVRVH
jgi:hypothetical protein